MGVIRFLLIGAASGWRAAQVMKKGGMNGGRRPVGVATSCLTVMSSTKLTTIGLLVLVTMLLGPRPLAAAPVPVRFAEGAAHGFLAAAHSRRRPHGVGRSPPGRPGWRGREPDGVPLQGRVVVRRDGGIHPAARLYHAELPPGAARARIRRRHRDLVGANREVPREDQGPQGRAGGGA